MIRHVTDLQLVVDNAAGKGRRSLRAIDNPLGSAPESFSAEGQEPFLVGSGALLELAYGLSTLGYVPIRVALVDPFLVAIEDEELEEEVLQLLRVRSRDAKSAVKRIANAIGPGVYVLSVSLREAAPESGVYTILQEGRVRTNADRVQHLASSIETIATNLKLA